MLVSDITTVALKILLDETEDYWSANELVPYVDEGQKEIFKLKPDVSTGIDASFSTAAGALQTLPSGAVVLIDVPRNASGQAITSVNRPDLDRVQPGWTTASQTNVIEHYMYEARDPTRFWVYPPAQSAASLVVIYAQPPTQVTATTSTVSIGDEWYGSLLSFTLYRAHTKTSKAAMPQHAIAHYQAFLRQMGQLDAAEALAAGGGPEIKEAM
ncbi:MAG: hypothetical protein L0H83_03460 [Salinisphaera sp.]|nr:hypothetical protein [Salinisphaera sp.]